MGEVIIGIYILSVISFSLIAALMLLVGHLKRQANEWAHPVVPPPWSPGADRIEPPRVTEVTARVRLEPHPTDYRDFTRVVEWPDAAEDDPYSPVPTIPCAPRAKSGRNRRG